MTTTFSCNTKGVLSVQPLTVRPPMQRMDRLPFLLAYALVAIFLVDWSLPEDELSIRLLWFLPVGIGHVAVLLGSFWNVPFRCLISKMPVGDIRNAADVLVTPHEHLGKAELCRLEREKDGAAVSFEFQRTRFTYDLSAGDGVFRKTAYPSSRLIGEYRNAAGVGAADVARLGHLYGRNEFLIPLPSFGELYKEHALAPFFVFQMFCCALWMLEENGQYALFTVAMLCFMEVTVVKQRLRNLGLIRAMCAKPSKILALRSGAWTQINTLDLFPGDIVSLVRPKGDECVPCDMLLLGGSVIVNEAMLTGESTPKLKDDIVGRDGAERLGKADRRHIAYGGTTIVQATPGAPSGNVPAPPDNGAVAYVLKTGFGTQQGKLMKKILFSTQHVTAQNLESAVFILFLLCFALAAAGYVLKKGLEDPTRSRFQILLNCSLIITSVVPPELPLVMSLAVNTSLMALSRLSIFCTEPFRLPFAGKLDTCCFDKTGTLTQEDLILQGFGGLGSGTEIVEPTAAPLDANVVVGGCHSLMVVDGELCGDPMEKVTLSTAKWSFDGADAVHEASGTRLTILHRNAFQSELKRSSTIVRMADGSSRVLVKGAPETIKTLLSSVPAGYDVYREHMRRGARVLALAWRAAGKTSAAEARTMPRIDVERGLTFAGFLVFSCPLKKDSWRAVQQLRRSSHRVVMITGDNPLTACHVARVLNIVVRPVLTLEDPAVGWLPAGSDDGRAHVQYDGSKAALAQLATEYDLCVTGKALQAILDKTREHEELFIAAVPAVFARVSPDHKEALLSAMKKQGLETLMCGDGTNDVGALKQAAVGIALMNLSDAQDMEQRLAQERARAKRKPRTMAELQKQMEEMQEEEGMVVPKLGDASIAAPLTIKSSSPLGVVQIIRQGRAALVTTMQMFKILAINCLISAYMQSVLYVAGVKLAESQLIVQGMVMSIVFLIMSRAQPCDKLSAERPMATIFRPYVFLTVLCQFAVHLYCLMAAVDLAEPFLRGQPVDIDGDFEPNLLNTVVYIIGQCMMCSTFVLNYRGRPFLPALTESRSLTVLLGGLTALTVIVTTELVPELNAKLDMVTFPDDAFRSNMLLLVVVDLVGATVVDRVLLRFLRDPVPPKPLEPSPDPFKVEKTASKKQQ